MGVFITVTTNKGVWFPEVGVLCCCDVHHDNNIIVMIIVNDCRSINNNKITPECGVSGYTPISISVWNKYRPATEPFQVCLKFGP